MLSLILLPTPYHFLLDLIFLMLKLNEMYYLLFLRLTEQNLYIGFIIIIFLFLSLKLNFKSIAFEHGIKFPAHQSLSQPPMSYAELQNRLFQSEGDKGSLSFKKISRETRRDSIDMDICTSTDDSTAKQLSFPICNTMQRSIGRWNRTISFIARVVFFFIF